MAELSRTVNRRFVAGANEIVPIAVPPQYNHIVLRMTRDTWPATGALISIGVAVGNVWRWFTPTNILHPSATPTIVGADCVLEYAWNPDNVELRAGLVAVRVDSASTFDTTITIEAYVKQ